MLLVSATLVKDQKKLLLRLKGFHLHLIFCLKVLVNITPKLCDSSAKFTVAPCIQTHTAVKDAQFSSRNQPPARDAKDMQTRPIPRNLSNTATLPVTKRFGFSRHWPCRGLWISLSLCSICVKHKWQQPTKSYQWYQIDLGTFFPSALAGSIEPASDAFRTDTLLRGKKTSKLPSGSDACPMAHGSHQLSRAQQGLKELSFKHCDNFVSTLAASKVLSKCQQRHAHRFEKIFKKWKRKTAAQLNSGQVRPLFPG